VWLTLRVFLRGKFRKSELPPSGHYDEVPHLLRIGLTGELGFEGVVIS